MLGRLSSILHLWPHARNRAPAADTLRPAPTMAATHRCLEAQAAMERSDFASAHLQLALAGGHQPSHPSLPELRGRLALLENNADLAVMHLDREHGPAHTRRRMLLAVARSRAGQTALAELDLADWSRRDDCPAEARVLLASMQLDRSAADDARRTLHLNLAHGSDVLTAKMLLLIDLEEQLPVSARQAAGFLAHGFSRHAATGQFLGSLELDGTPMAPLEMIDQLAAELLRREEVVPTLVAAYRIEPRPERIELLRRALHRIVDTVSNPVAIVEALAELAALAGEVDDARRWAQRGLRADPYSARLALLLDRLSSTDTADVDDLRTLEALRRVCAAHPAYSDVRRALILRYQRSGLAELATSQAQRWLEQSPDHPMAQHTARELAA